MAAYTVFRGCCSWVLPMLPSGPHASCVFCGTGSSEAMELWVVALLAVQVPPRSSSTTLAVLRARTCSVHPRIPHAGSASFTRAVVPHPAGILRLPLWTQWLVFYFFFITFYSFFFLNRKRNFKIQQRVTMINTFILLSLAT